MWFEPSHSGHRKSPMEAHNCSFFLYYLRCEFREGQTMGTRMEPAGGLATNSRIQSMPFAAKCYVNEYCAALLGAARATPPTRDVRAISIARKFSMSTPVDESVAVPFGAKVFQTRRMM